MSILAWLQRRAEVDSIFEKALVTYREEEERLGAALPETKEALEIARSIRDDHYAKEKDAWNS